MLLEQFDDRSMKVNVNLLSSIKTVLKYTLFKKSIEKLSYPDHHNDGKIQYVQNLRRWDHEMSTNPGPQDTCRALDLSSNEYPLE